MCYPKQRLRRPPSLTPLKPPADGPTVSTAIPISLECAPAAQITSLAMSEEDSVTPITTPTASADKLANPPTTSKTASDTRSHPEQVYPKWVKVHSSCMVVSIGSIPCNPGDIWQHCCNCSSSQWKRAWHLLEEEQWALRGISSFASLGSSPEPAPQEGEDLEAEAKVPPPGFWEIARSLTAGKSPGMEINSLWTEVAQVLLVEPKVAMLVSATICQDGAMGTVYLLTVTASMGLMNLELLPGEVSCQGQTIEELTKEDLAESCL